MTATPCALEGTVLEAIRCDTWSAELHTHVSGCAWCSETALVAGALRVDAGADEAPLPDPRAVWLEAQLRKRRLGAARAARPVTLVRRFAALCTAVVGGGVAAWLYPDIGRWLGALHLPSPDVVSGFAFLNGILLLIASGVFVVLAAYALVTSLRPS